MKLIREPKPKTKDDPRSRMVEDVRTEFFRLGVAVDEVKARGTIEELDVAQKVLWGALLVIDGLMKRKGDTGHG